MIALKLHKLHPNLGNKNSQLESGDDDITSPWILHLSKGGLLMPDSTFLQACEDFDRLFVEFQRDNVDKSDMVIERFYERLVAAFGNQRPGDVLMLFARVRTLNKHLEVDAASVTFRRLEQFSQHDLLALVFVIMCDAIKVNSNKQR